MSRHAVIPGSFMLPHAGHVTLIQTALALTERATVLLFAGPDDPVSADQRRSWLRQLCPGAEVRICAGPPPDEAPLDVLSHTIQKSLGIVDKVIGSEAYVADLAKVLGVAHMVLDPDRVAVPISSTDILLDPVEHWRWIPGVVRPHLQKRLTLVGPESTGKSHLTRMLAAEFGGPFVPEYGRPYEQFRGEEDYAAWELFAISERHVAHRNALAPLAGPVLFEDTDPLLTAVWAEMLLGHPLPDLEANIMLPDHYILLDKDAPWEDDPLRYFSRNETRAKFFDLTRAKLEALGATYTLVSGDFAAREAQCRALTMTLLSEMKG